MTLTARSSLRLIALALALLLPGLAHAESPGEQAIRLMDEAMTRATDQTFVYDVFTQEPGKSPRKLEMKVQVKGDKWRLIEFLSPGDVKGMKALVLSLTQMYVYLPAYRKIRRVASHVRSQSFMGTALSQDDTSITTYGDVYRGQLIAEDKDSWTVLGTRRPGKDFPYGKLEFVISKKYHHPTQLTYYSDKGVKLKTETRQDYDCKQGNICNAVTMKMVDHSRNGLWTTLTRKQWEVNSGLPDSLFSPRGLQRSH